MPLFLMAVVLIVSIPFHASRESDNYGKSFLVPEQNSSSATTAAHHILQQQQSKVQQYRRTKLSQTSVQEKLHLCVVFKLRYNCWLREDSLEAWGSGLPTAHTQTNIQLLDYELKLFCCCC